MEDGRFGPDLEEFTRRTLLRADMFIRAVGIKTFTGVIRDTPVGDPDLWKGKAPAGYVGGRLRANWRCSLSAADTSTSESTAHGESIPAMQATVETADRHSVLWLSNSLPYAARIEYDGHSSQAPAGMVRRNVARIKANLANEMRRIRAIS